MNTLSVDRNIDCVSEIECKEDIAVANGTNTCKMPIGNVWEGQEQIQVLDVP